MNQPASEANTPTDELVPFDEAWTQAQSFALLEELSNTSRLIELGISEIHRLSGSNDFHHGALQLLAQGYERLLKCTIVAALSARGEPLPDRDQIKRTWGHGLVDLHSTMLELAAAVPEYADRPAVAIDLAFMRSDPDLAAMLELLSNLAGGGRYFDLDTVLGFNDGNPDFAPSRIWSELEVRFWDQVANGDLITDLAGEEVHSRIGMAIAVVLDRYTRAIGRMWHLGALGPGAAGLAVGSLDRVSRFTDEQLGVPRPL